MKKTFAAKTFASKTFASGHWTGVGVSVVVVFVGLIGITDERAIVPGVTATAVGPWSEATAIRSICTATAENPWEH